MAMKNSSVVAMDYRSGESGIKIIWMSNAVILHPDFAVYYTNVKIHENIY